MSIQGDTPEVTESDVIGYFAKQVADGIKGDRSRGQRPSDRALLEAAGADDLPPRLQGKILRAGRRQA